MKYLRLVLVPAALICGYSALAQTAPKFDLRPDGIVLPVNGGFLKLEPRSANIVHVAFAQDRAFFDHPSIAVLPAGSPPTWKVATINGTIVLSTASLQARVDNATGAITFLDSTGQVILAEKSAGRTIEAADVLGEKTFHVRQQWLGHDDESLYGLGQQQLGTVDVKGYDLELWQRNTNVTVPFLVSSRGYGILWDNPSYTRFGDLRPFEEIPATALLDTAGQPGGVTTGNLTATGEWQSPVTSPTIGFSSKGGGGSMSVYGLHPASRTEGSIVAPVTGEYQFRAYSNGGIKVWLDGQPIMDHWRQDWLPEYDQIKVSLEAGKKYALKIETDGERSNVLRLLWKTPRPAAEANTTALWSNVGDGIDYDFVQGPALDTVIAGFRTLTGAATMLPQWAFGLWQSRDHYTSAGQLLDVLKTFRAKQIPLDNIVQDWQYWNVRPDQNDWGSHQFSVDYSVVHNTDGTTSPINPVDMIKTVHDAHAHIMISVWGKFYEGTANFNALNQAGYLFQSTLKEGLLRDNKRYTYFDPFQAGARKMFWDQINTALFSKGIDAWWMDATEPEIVSPPSQENYAAHTTPNGMGSGSRMQNGYALMTAKGVYEGQRAAAPDQRVFILTRSGFAGEQRYGALTWSGDVTSTWTALRKQIPAGLGFSIAGMPYWTTDTGGYIMQTKFANNPTPENLASFLELNDRWFQFSTFCPVLRVHGQQQLREMFNLGDENSAIFKSELKFDQLRYALFPYIYSLAGGVTQDGGTIMRPLVMDFPADHTARELTDEYMFGPAFLVAPVTTYQARNRSVYLPADTTWYDFWTGAQVQGGATLDAPAPYDSMPVYLRAGSIISTGPSVQYIGEKAADPLTLYVYAGADGKFTLYEDDGLSYKYENGSFARIPLTWNDATHTLTIGQRMGSFPGMVSGRSFNVVLVSPGHPVGFSFSPTNTTTIQYNGTAVETKLAP